MERGGGDNWEGAKRQLALQSPLIDVISRVWGNIPRRSGQASELEYVRDAATVANV